MSGFDELAQSQLLVAQAMSGVADDMTGWGAGQITGTTTNDDATAGNVGEYVSNDGGSTLLAPDTPANLAQIDLTAGDWDVSATLYFNSSFDGQAAGGITTTSATLVLARPNYAIIPVSSAFAGNYSITIGPLRRSLSATTTYYLVGEGISTTGLVSAQGFIRARRMR